MQLKDIAKGLREAAELLPSEPWYTAAINAIKEAEHLCLLKPTRRIGIMSELKLTENNQRYQTLKAQPRLELRLAPGSTIRCLMAAEAVERLAARLEVAKPLQSNWSEIKAAHRREKLPTGLRAPETVIGEFVRDQEYDNAREYARLVGREDLLPVFMQ